MFTPGVTVFGFPLIGARVTLRRPERPADVFARLAFGYDPEIDRLCGNRPAQNDIEYSQAHAENEIKNLSETDLGWIIEYQGKYIGEVRLEGGNPSRKSLRLGICIRSRDCWGNGLGTETVRLVVNFAKTLGKNEIDLFVSSDNKRAIGAYKANGFSEVVPSKWLSNNAVAGSLIVMRRPLHSAAP